MSSLFEKENKKKELITAGEIFATYLTESEPEDESEDESIDSLPNLERSFIIQKIINCIFNIFKYHIESKHDVILKRNDSSKFPYIKYKIKHKKSSNRRN